jgi:replication factor A1
VGISYKEKIQIGSLKPDVRNLDIIAKIVNIGASRTIVSKKETRQHIISEVLLGDETGSVILTLWDNQIEMFKAEDVVQIKRGYTTIYKGSLRLNIGRNGSIEKIEKEIPEVNTKNNVSEKTHIQVPWRLSEARPFKRRRRR